MNKSPVEVFQKRVIGFLLLVLVCFFNTIPLFVISILANLSSVSGLLCKELALLNLHVRSQHMLVFYVLGPRLPLAPLHLFPVYSHPPFLPFLVSSYPSSCAT